MPEPWRFCVVAYAVTRAVVAAGILTCGLVTGRPASVRAAAYRWDGFWYLHIARVGYSRSLRAPLPGVAHRFSVWAFFPAFSGLVSAVHAITRLPLDVAGIVLSLAAGLAAVRAVFALGEEYAGVATGRAAAVLICAWPGSAAFGLPYSEGLAVAATAAALVLLLRRRWWWAGVAGALATATRATGVAVLAAAAVTAGVEVARERRLQPLAAPLLTAVGLAAFLGYGWARTGDVLVWRHAENLWHQQFNLGYPMYVHWVRGLTTGVRVWGVLLEIVGMAALVTFAVVARKRWGRLTLPMGAYAIVAAVLILGYSAVGTRPRMVLGLVPGFVWLAAWLPRRLVMRVALGCLPVLYATSFLWMWKVTP